MQLSPNTKFLNSFRVVALVGLAICLLAGCISPPPKSPENVCEIFKEKRNWYKAAQRARKRWNIPIGISMAFIYQESGFRANSRPERQRLLGLIPWKRTSTARGYAQAIDATWDDYEQYIEKTRGWFPKFPNRTNFFDAVDFIGWYNRKSQQTLGISRTNAKALYLAYHEGWQGYRNRAYENKVWLVQAADNVEKRARQYQIQYLGCKKKLTRWFDFF